MTALIFLISYLSSGSETWGLKNNLGHYSWCRLSNPFLLCLCTLCLRWLMFSIVTSLHKMQFWFILIVFCVFVWSKWRKCFGKYVSMKGSAIIQQISKIQFSNNKYLVCKANFLGTNIPIRVHMFEYSHTPGVELTSSHHFLPLYAVIHPNSCLLELICRNEKRKIKMDFLP